MNFTKNRLSALALAAGLLGIASLNPAQATTAPLYTLATLTGMPWGSAINNAGLVVGSDGSRALIWQQNGAQPLDIPTLAPDSARGVSVSSNGQIATTVGSYLDGHALRWKDGAYTLLTAASYETRAYGINDAGLVVGYTRLPPDPFFPATTDVATTWSVNNVATPLAGLSGWGSQALAVNNQGLVVGWSDFTADSIRAVQWVGGVPTALVSPGAGVWDEARGISESGLIVGFSRNTAGRDRAALWVGASDLAFDLGTLAGDDSSFANAVNRSGQAVGNSFRFAGTFYDQRRAVLWEGFVATDLNRYLSPEQMQAGWHLYDATSINDAGAIVVNGVNIATYEYQAFLLTAVPEPGTWALWLAGLAGVGATARRRIRAARA